MRRPDSATEPSGGACFLSCHMDDMHTYCNINAAVCNTSSFFLSDHLAGGLPWTWVFLGGHSVCSILFYVKTCKTFIKLGQRMLNITKIWKWIVHNLSVVFMRLNWFAFIPLNGMSLNCNLPRIIFFFEMFWFLRKYNFCKQEKHKKGFVCHQKNAHKLLQWYQIHETLTPKL